MWVSENTMEQMPMWCPPTPPQQDTDVFIDSTMSFLYDINVMSESQLPPVYVKKELKRTHTEAGLVETRRSLKIPRKEELPSTAPRSLFYQHALFKIRRDAKWQKYRGSMRSSAISIPGKPTPNKLVTEQPLWHDWTIHEDMALLKVIQNFQGLPLNLLIVSPGHVPNWDFVADYVNTVSITYRSPKQCRQRYENSLIQREEGKQLFYESNLRKKKNKSGGSAVGPSQKFVYHQKSNRPMRTAQLYTQDNNSSFSQIMVQRYEALKNVSSKYTISQSNSTTRQSLTGGASTLLQKNPKHTAVLNECGIDFDRPMLPVEVANRRQERLAREKKMTPEARLQIMKGLVGQSIGVTTATTASSSTAPTTQSTNISQVQAATVGTSNVTTAPSTPPKTLRGQRIITSPLQSSNVVSVSSLSPAQLQAAQRLIVSASSPSSNKTVVTQQVQSKTLSPAQLQIIRQAASFKQQLRVQGQIGGVKTTTVTIGGQPAVVQFTQAQPSPRAQFVRQAGTTVQVGGKAAITRTVTESEVAQILKKQQQLQQQKALAAAAAANQPTSIQNISSQLLAQSFQQAGSSGTSVATLVKTVSSSGGGSQTTVTIPVTGVAIATGGKGLQSTLKTTTPQQLRQLQIQQQLLAQKKLGAAAGTQKLSLGQVAAAAGKGNVQTQLIVGSKPLTTAMTVQQLQQVIRSPLGVSQGPVVLAKGTPRVIPVNAGLGTKQTIQVVTATSQGLGTAFRPQSSSTLAGALTGVKVQTSAQAQQALLSQVSVALQNQGIGVRQGSPVRIQTANGTPLVAVTVQSSSSTANTTAQTTADTTTLRFTKK